MKLQHRTDLAVIGHLCACSCYTSWTKLMVGSCSASSSSLSLKCDLFLYFWCVFRTACVCVCDPSTFTAITTAHLHVAGTRDSWRVFCLALACEFPDVFVQFGSSSVLNCLMWCITRWIQEASRALKGSFGQILVELYQQHPLHHFGCITHI